MLFDTPIFILFLCVVARCYWRLGFRAQNRFLLLSQTYGVNIVLLVPPTLREDHSREIQAMGEQSGVPVWVLSPPGEFPRDLYRDGFHLNERGSEIFTSA